MSNVTTATTVASKPTGIVADDLTGATDSAVQFAREEWQARLALGLTGESAVAPGSVVAVVTDARPMPADSARDTTKHAVERLLTSGIEQLFVKIDSTMRGSVLHQIQGALEAWEMSHPSAIAVVCSAYPAMGRTIENGRILVDGAGVETTSVGTDPVTPLATSELAELLPGSAFVSLRGLTAAERIETIASADSQVIVVDASTDADLQDLAATIAALGSHAIPVGSAGLAVAMAHVWSDRNNPRHSHSAHAIQRVAVVVSSLHEASRTQAEFLTEQLPNDSVRVFAPSLELALRPQASEEWARAELTSTPSLPQVIVISSPSERCSTEEPTGLTHAELIADSLAKITAAIVEHTNVDAVMLLGGEGARATLGALGATSIHIYDAIREGVPVGELEGGIAAGLTVVTKAGGFGAESAVLDIVQELLDPTIDREGTVS
ncbi:MAG: four-carbon acid sugar kinase family protein [Leucobacter sp.]